MINYNDLGEDQRQENLSIDRLRGLTGMDGLPNYSTFCILMLQNQEKVSENVCNWNQLIIRLKTTKRNFRKLEND